MNKQRIESNITAAVKTMSEILVTAEVCISDFSWFLLQCENILT